jgi:predicted nuclease with RNAse H fold
VLAVGIDVAEERKGLDLVALDTDRRVVASAGRLPVDETVALVLELAPVLVCIDCPSGWSRSGRSRPAERELARRGFPSFYTPTDPGEHPFYRWMRVGISLYRKLEPSYPLYRGSELEMKSVEVFPSAVADLLASRRRPKDLSKLRFRREVLCEQHVKMDALPNADRVDAALCALTGCMAVEGNFESVGGPSDGYIVMPRSGAREPPRTRAQVPPA